MPLLFFVDKAHIIYEFLIINIEGSDYMIVV